MVRVSTSSGSSANDYWSVLRITIAPRFSSHCHASRRFSDSPLTSIKVAPHLLLREVGRYHIGEDRGYALRWKIYPFSGWGEKDGVLLPGSMVTDAVVKLATSLVELISARKSFKRIASPKGVVRMMSVM